MAVVGGEGSPFAYPSVIFTTQKHAGLLNSLHLQLSQAEGRDAWLGTIRCKKALFLYCATRHQEGAFNAETPLMLNFSLACKN